MSKKKTCNISPRAEAARRCMNESGSFVQVWMKLRALQNFHQNWTIRRVCQSLKLNLYKVSLKGIIICYVERAAKKWASGCCWTCWKCCWKWNCWLASRSGTGGAWASLAVVVAVKLCWHVLLDQKQTTKWCLTFVGTVVGVDASIAFVASCWSYAAGFDVLFTRNRHCCGSNAVVRQVRNDTSLGSHLLHHFSKGSFAYRRVVEPYGVKFWIELSCIKRKWRS